MRTLENLARFVAVKDNEDERHEIREYVNEYAADIAEAFGMPVDRLRLSVATLADDTRLARRLIAEVKRAKKEGREEKAHSRTFEAQRSADLLGHVATWEDDRASVDVVSLIASALTNRDDLLVFACDGFMVPIRMRALFGLRSLGRVDLSATIDATGLRIRWTTGGLNLRPVCNPNDIRTASKIVVNLPPRCAAVAA